MKRIVSAGFGKIAATVLLCTPVFFAPPARAQDNQYEFFTPNREANARNNAMVRLPPQIVEKLALQLGIPPSSRFYKNFSHFTAGKFSDKEFVHEAILAMPKDPRVIKHLRSDKGIPFPDAAALESASPRKQNRTAVSAESKAAMLGVQKKASAAMLKRATTVRDIPNCREDKTEKSPNSARGDGRDPSAVLFDMLFVRKNNVPLDPDEAFGKRTLVLPFQENVKTLASIATAGIKIPCLPYRLRGTGSFFYKDQGLNALKNYDANQNGPGVLNETVKAKYRGF